MKRSTIIIFLLLAMLKTQAQDYLISFAGSGDTTAVSTVKVDNLTSGATVTLNAGDILHLIPALGIGTLGPDNGSLQLYPNPMAEQSILTFVAPENGKAVISVVDLSGKTVYQISTWLSPGAHSFRVSGINQGMYFLKVSGKNYNYSTKLICQCSLQSEVRIEYVSSVTNTTGNHAKSIATTVDMPYTDGNILMYKGVAGQYSTVVTDVPTSSRTTTFTFVACMDSDGNHYATVRIGIGKSGAQIWMAENLAVGIRINGNLAQTNNGIIERFCYDDNDNNCNIYGGLYQWNEMMQYVETPGAKGICPNGWHIPTMTEWATLTNYLGGYLVAGGKLKETGNTHWLSPNTGATNESGFTALAGGWFNLVFAQGFAGLNQNAYFWSSTPDNLLTYCYYLYVDYTQNRSYTNNDPRDSGFSVRCVQN
jgi:uncharacterized protein (TIGR02145 family)